MIISFYYSREIEPEKYSIVVDGILEIVIWGKFRNKIPRPKKIMRKIVELRRYWFYFDVPENNWNSSGWWKEFLKEYKETHHVWDPELICIFRTLGDD